MSLKRVRDDLRKLRQLVRGKARRRVTIVVNEEQAAEVRRRYGHDPNLLLMIVNTGINTR